MRTINRHVLSACLRMGFLWTLWSGHSHAAVPKVVLATDPLTSLHCPKQSIDRLMLSGATTSAARIAGDGVSLYQAAFDPTTWSGSLKKYRLGLDEAEGAIRVASVAEWDAADILTGSPSTAAKPAPENRNIYTSTIVKNQSSLTIPFLWKDLSLAQRSSLHTSSVTGSDDQLGEKRLDYLRGRRQYELGNIDGIFRTRDRILGAIARSVPIFVGAPSTRLQGGEYQAFHDANKARRSAVYVGAGDGMLHAFDAITGEELFAYIPQAVFKNLSSLTSPDGVYKPFVDGAITVGEARIGNQWRTILASGMGGGAQGVFALDVTTPDQFEKGWGALWEFTDADDADMGNVLGAPLIAKFKVKVVNGVPSYRDFVVVAGGVNNYLDDGAGNFNSHAPGVLFLLALDKSRSDPWKIGSNYFKFITPISEKTLANGLIAPALSLADDGAVSNIYSGDLQGNLWRFDFGGSAPWPSAMGTASAKPLFTAMDEHQNRQAITQKVQVVSGPYGGQLVLFGTGKFMEATDTDSARFKTQSFYGILDAGDGKAVTRNQLIERKLIPAISGSGVLEIEGSEVKYGAPNKGDKGWYFDFLESHKTGERNISGARINDGSLFFNTLIPHSDPCAKHTGRTYVLNVITGLTAYANLTAYLTNVSIVNAPIVMATIPDVPVPDASGKRRVTKKLEVLEPVVTDKIGEHVPSQKVTAEATTTSGRLSWREIVNWVELRSSATKKPER